MTTKIHVSIIGRRNSTGENAQRDNKDARQEIIIEKEGVSNMRERGILVRVNACKACNVNEITIIIKMNTTRRRAD